MTDIAIRPASMKDAREIARLFQISSEGVADYIWSGLAGPDEDILDVGAARYARENTAFSYQNCLLACSGDRVVGMLHSFVMTAPPPGEKPGYDCDDPVLLPMAELEVPDTLYISGLAINEDMRGQGIGQRLMQLAFDRTRDEELEGVSLIVFECNEGAHRLYKRLGFEEVDRRPIVPDPLIHVDGGDAILMLWKPQ